MGTNLLNNLCKKIIEMTSLPFDLINFACITVVYILITLFFAVFFGTQSHMFQEVIQVFKVFILLHFLN